MNNSKRTKLTGISIKIEDNGIPIGKFHVGDFEKIDGLLLELKKKYR